MLLLRLWNYIRGYVIIIVEGYFLEKFINICTHRQILLWDIKRQKNYVMSLKISIRGFRMLRPVAKKSGCRVRIAGKRGLPFILNRYKQRKTFVFGGVLFVALFFFLTSFVWKVELTGNENLDTAFIMDKLSSMGVRNGVLKYSIDTDKVVNNMMLEIKELGWIGISIRGTKVKVQVNERKLPPKLIPKSVPCNIIARRDGLIESIMVLDGIEKVKVGEAVVKGQILISGEIENRNPAEPKRLVHAMGSVKARTWYEKSSEVITKFYEKKRTDRVYNHYSLLILGRKLGPVPWKIPFNSYERVEIKKGLSLGEDLVLPFEILIERLHEYELEENEISIDEAKDTAYEKAYKEVLDSLPEGAQITSTDVKYKETGNGKLMAVATIECLEEIGTAKEIGGE